ncbi:MAG: co-chaperone GroES [Chloroflexi bacterium]|nr:co-chaperone GroES [Chloroflexota bacterium]
MPREYKPFGDRVLVRPIEEEKVSVGGIVLPDTAQERPQEGEVVAVGPGRTSDEGKRIQLEVKVGDRVVYSKYAGTEIKEEGKEYLILKESDLLAKVG